jgi:four helix bundle protein
MKNRSGRSGSEVTVSTIKRSNCSNAQTALTVQPVQTHKQLELFKRDMTMTVRNFEDLEIWKLARALTNRIYSATTKDDFARDFGLRDQIRRASVSVMSNISEGFERGGNQEFLQFLAIAKGSCGEVRCQLYVASDQGYVSKENADDLIDQHRKLSIMLHKFIEHLKRSKFKGQKYKIPQPDPKIAELDAMIKSYLKK